MSLDLLHASLFHVKISSTEGEKLRETALFTGIQRSNIPKLLAPLSEASMRDAIDNGGKEGMAFCVLGFRTLAIALPVVGVEYLHNLTRASLDAVKRTCDDLHSFREAQGDPKLGHVALLDKLQLAIACLGFLQAVWKDSDRLTSLEPVSYTHLTLPTICSV